VLGLLNASAKGFYDSQNTEVTQAAANIVLLDRILAHYGLEAEGVHAVLHSSIARWVDPQDPGDVPALQWIYSSV